MSDWRHKIQYFLGCGRLERISILWRKELRKRRKEIKNISKKMTKILEFGEGCHREKIKGLPCSETGGKMGKDEFYGQRPGCQGERLANSHYSI